MEESGFKPRFLICADCGEEFVFTAAAQQYFAERGYTEDPKRCKTCHTAHKKGKRQNGSTGHKEPADFPDITAYQENK
jgi:hypothetical protein